MIVSIVGIIVLPTVYWLWPNSESAKENYEVRSENQSGGITAGKVIFGKEPRHLDSMDRQNIDKLLDETKATQSNVSSIAMDKETYDFAEEIIGYLKERGIQVLGHDKIYGYFGGDNYSPLSYFIDEEGVLQIRVRSQTR